ncbi:hypothetical protein [Arthrobacter sp. IK3]|uniref:hypothetical protein n=1 Tax=Arthrobacter sp. IK3 TaxID=3448169 RepID=UPI003EE0D715
MTTDFLHRQPAGIPAGGQFAGTHHAESPVRLFDRGDGSFMKPSPSATAEHCIGFWSSIEVPDEVIDQVIAEYAVFRTEEINARIESEMSSWVRAWKAENIPPKREGRELDRFQARYTEEFNAYQESIKPGIFAEHPNQLGSYDVRQLVRATQMRRHRPHPAKFPEETAKVMDHEIELFDEVLTVGEIDEKYRLTNVARAMDSIFPPKPNPEVQEALEQLARINENLVQNRHDATY